MFRGNKSWTSRALLVLFGVVTTASAVVGYSLLCGPVVKFPPSNKNDVILSPPPQSSVALRTLWFGHSLMRYGAEPSEAVPAVDIPKAVDEIHELARKAGRTSRPPGVTASYYDGPHDLLYWLDGNGRAEDKLRATTEPWDAVIGVGFMHLVTQKGGKRTFRSKVFAPRTFKDDLTGALKDAADLFSLGRYYRRDVDRLTLGKYRFIQIVRDHSPASTWLNYVAPVMNDQPENQASVDARFACIAEVAKHAGTRAANVPVGAAFRRAETALRAAGLFTSLQRKDRLHYTSHGALLASTVFYAFLYDVDPRGLAPPPSLDGFLQGAKRNEIVALIQDVAWSTTRLAKAGTLIDCDNARLPVDEVGLRLLKE